MSQVLGPVMLHCATVYVDDILITSSNWEEYCEQVERVLDRLFKNIITIKLDKSKLIAGEVQFWGFILPLSRIIPSPEKIKAIQQFPTVRYVRQLQ